MLDACSDESEREMWHALHEHATSARGHSAHMQHACACGSAVRSLCSQHRHSKAGDDSEDDGFQAACRERPVNLLLRVLVFRATTPLFETVADNFAMSTTNPGAFYALVQSDAIILEAGWNLRLASALNAHSDLLGVSGRCSVAFVPHGASSSVGNCIGREDHMRQWAAAKAGQEEGVGGAEEREAGGSRDGSASAAEAVCTSYACAAYPATAYVHDVAVRSPLLLRALYVQWLGFLDEGHFTLGGDDHDLAARGRAVRGWSTAYVPLHVFDDRSSMSVNNSVLWRTESERRSELEAVRNADPSHKEELLSRATGPSPKSQATSRALSPAQRQEQERWRQQARSLQRFEAGLQAARDELANKGEPSDSRNVSSAGTLMAAAVSVPQPRPFVARCDGSGGMGSVASAVTSGMASEFILQRTRPASSPPPLPLLYEPPPGPVVPLQPLVPCDRGHHADGACERKQRRYSTSLVRAQGGARPSAWEGEWAPMSSVAWRELAVELSATGGLAAWLHEICHGKR